MKNNKGGMKIDKKKVTRKLSQEDSRNKTWQINQALIQDAYLNLIVKLKRCPTRLELSQETNLSEPTINKHVKEFKFEPVHESLRLLTPDIITSIYKSSRKGNAASQKLWLQLFEGFSERLEHTGKDGEKLFPDKINIVVKK